MCNFHRRYKQQSRMKQCINFLKQNNIHFLWKNRLDEESQLPMNLGKMILSKKSVQWMFHESIILSVGQ